MLIALGILTIILAISVLAGFSNYDFWPGFFMGLGACGIICAIVGGVILILAGVGIL